VTERKPTVANRSFLFGDAIYPGHGPEGSEPEEVEIPGSINIASLAKFQVKNRDKGRGNPNSRFKIKNIYQRITVVIERPTWWLSTGYAVMESYREYCISFIHTEDQAETRQSAKD
jgi:hypothetical protein